MTTEVQRIRVRLTPRGGRDAIEGWVADEMHGRVLKVRVASPPVDGAANEALIRLLAKTLKRPARDIALVGGETARLKVIEVAGIDASQLEGRLA